MSGLSSIMDTSLSALLAAQAGLATSGHNIANANTPGYNRQDVVFGTRQPRILPYGSIGRGVEVQGIRRIQDEFLLGNLRSQAARLNSYASVDTTLYDIEGVLGSVDNDHLGNALNKFFAAWNDLAQPPFSLGLKEGVLTAARTLVDDFHAIDDALGQIEDDLNRNIQAEIDNLNRLLTGVGDMNRQVMSAETNGQPANDLRDQRDLLVTRIAELAEVTVLNRDDGSQDIILAGRTMVARDHVTLLEGTPAAAGSGYRLDVVTAASQQAVTLSEGRLQGLLNSRDIHLDQVRSQLDTVAAQLVAEVNALHTQGTTVAGSGIAFFTGSTMRDIAVNSAVADNPGLVARGRTGADGDNELALAIADLADNGRLRPDNRSVGESYRVLVLEIAGQRNSHDFMVENQQSVVASLSARMASISGVSLDEEGANLVRYQNSYNAAAKVIATVQEMYDTLLNMV